MTVSARAYEIARYWAEGHNRPAVVVRGYARQVQDHLDHSADPAHLTRVAAWMSLQKADCLDLDLAMHYAGSPQPAIVARGGHPCPCRGGKPGRGGAPAPPIVRQLIRRSHKTGRTLERH